MARPHMPRKKFGVNFKSVSIQKTTARVGIKFTRGTMTLEECADFFCNRRLIGVIVLARSEDAPGQKTLVDDLEHSVDGAFDVKGFRTTKDDYSASLTFSLADISVEELAKFASGTGTVLIHQTAEIPEPEKEEKETKRRTPGSLKTDEPWREVNLDKIFDPEKRIRKSLSEAGINTVGQLADYTSADKQLTDITGIGEKAADEIDEALVDFYVDNPDAGERK